MVLVNFSIAVREHLYGTFEQRWVGSGGAVSRPAGSHDLNPFDLFLWGYLKL